MIAILAAALVSSAALGNYGVGAMTAPGITPSGQQQNLNTDSAGNLICEIVMGALPDAGPNPGQGAMTAPGVTPSGTQQNLNTDQAGNLEVVIIGGTTDGGFNPAAMTVGFIDAGYAAISSASIGSANITSLQVGSGTAIKKSQSVTIVTTAQQGLPDAGLQGPGYLVSSSTPVCVANPTASTPAIFPCVCGNATYAFGFGCPDGGTQGSLAGLTYGETVASCNTSFLATDAGYGLPANFNAGSVYTAASGQRAIALTDLNQDGYPDIATGAISSNVVDVLLGQGNGAFGTHATYAMTGAVGIVAAPFAGTTPGAPDIVASGLNTVGNFIVLINNGAGGFSDGGQYATLTSDPREVAFGNLSGTGWGDLVFGDDNTNSSGVGVCINQGDGGAGQNFQCVYYDAGYQSKPWGVVAADLNHDGCVDVAATLYTTSQLVVFPNTCDGGGLGPPQYFTVGLGPNGVLATQLTGSGWPDIITANNTAGTVSVLLNTGDGGAGANFAAQTTYSAGSGPAYLVAADLNNDGNMDIAVPSDDVTSAFQVLAGNGTGTLAAAVSFTSVAAMIGMAAGDLRHSGRQDLVATTITTNNQVYLNTTAAASQIGCSASITPTGNVSVQINNQSALSGQPTAVQTHMAQTLNFSQF